MSNCTNCGKETTNPKFCSLRCSALYYYKFNTFGKKKPSEIKYCAKCGKETTNPKFCSRNCSASFSNNLRLYKRLPSKVTKKCNVCGCPIKKSSVMCKSCRNTYDTSHSNETIRDLLLSHGTNYTTKIRMQSRYRMKNKNTACIICGYTNHIHIAHIKPVASFPLDTLITEVNSLENLVPLCPNHHWEFDHGLLKLDIGTPG